MLENTVHFDKLCAKDLDPIENRGIVGAKPFLLKQGNGIRGFLQP